MKPKKPVGPHTHIFTNSKGARYPRWEISGRVYDENGRLVGDPADHFYTKVRRPASAPEGDGMAEAPREVLVVPAPGSFLAGLTSAQRKEVPLKRGLFDYFPDALALVARHSYRSNEKHNPGKPLHWSREKSSDHADCILRHVAGFGLLDDGVPNELGAAWRSLAALQLDYEAHPEKYK